MLHIIDDEEVVRDSLSWLAASRSIEARSYASAQQFLDSLDGSFDANGDCVLLDVRMPDMNGIGPVRPAGQARPDGAPARDFPHRPRRRADGRRQPETGRLRFL